MKWPLNLIVKVVEVQVLGKVSSSSTDIYSFIFSNCFILFRVAVDLEHILGVHPWWDHYICYHCCCYEVDKDYNNFVVIIIVVIVTVINNTNNNNNNIDTNNTATAAITSPKKVQYMPKSIQTPDHHMQTSFPPQTFYLKCISPLLL